VLTALHVIARVSDLFPIPPGSGRVEVFGGSPGRAVRRGPLGAMPQEGGPASRVTVREL